MFDENDTFLPYSNKYNKDICEDNSLVYSTHQDINEIDESIYEDDDNNIKAETPSNLVTKTSNFEISYITPTKKSYCISDNINSDKIYEKNTLIKSTKVGI